ncbi:hypothetical protein DFQ28_004608 [Apophysomyces sp. BC1034]|nr:hypothetical protein DFQ30_004523 [Apophysomyces sp. BC1015]KAG0180967.1 hypothetical protein DFQ29_009717 [Apophysomyces sp. BC1021]KAG0188602.1 hypothetical protein DFQ28_004608 [Apophysomyces sp. BC1034]
MTRSPLQANSNHSGRNRPSEKESSLKNISGGQRERLARDVRRRQHPPAHAADIGTANDALASTSGRAPGVIGTSPVLPVVSTLTPEQMYSNFEEWIKMCTDNKINATNTWNFALIDYFHEMTFLRDGDSINFQKASCTLDGCVKIYTSRVDSVASETGKLLSGLADGARESTSGDNADSDEIQREDNGERRTRRRGHRFETTLLKDFSSISLKKFDLDFTVDPLFKKTSADFDEGGARGLLLNHLSIDQHCKIIFDASDANTDRVLERISDDTLEDYDNAQTENQEYEENELNKLNAESGSNEVNEVNEESQPVEESKSKENGSTEESDSNEERDSNEEDKYNEELKSDEEMVDQSGRDDLDKGDAMDIVAESQSENEKDIVEKEQEAIDGLKTNDTFEKNEEKESQEGLIEISRLRAKLPPVEVFTELRICPSLQDYDFFSDKNQNLPDLDDHGLPQDDADIGANQNDNVNADVMDDDMGDFFDYEDIERPLLGGLDGDPFNEDEHEDEHDHGDGSAAGDVDPAGFQEEDYLMAFRESTDRDLFSYFDSTLTKNWAGPEHWKLRRPVNKSKETQNQENTEEGEKPKRKTKQAFEIEFINSDDVDEEEIFATIKSSKITTPIPKESTNKAAKHLLPDDMHFSSKQLLRFFLKPTFTVNSGKKSQNPETAEMANAEVPDTTDYDFYDEPVDVQYWADRVPENTQDNTGANDTPADVPNADQTMLSAFDDTFYQDTYYDDGETSMLYGDPLITNHHLKKVKPLYVNYARTAKRVDVKKLKDNIWKALTLSKKDSASTTTTELESLEFVQGERRFTDVVQEIKKMYPSKVVKDISVPFCFICLLHLANEKNLTISSFQGNNDEFVLGEGDWMQNEEFLNEVTIVQNT